MHPYVVPSECPLEAERLMGDSQETCAVSNAVHGLRGPCNWRQEPKSGDRAGRKCSPSWSRWTMQDGARGNGLSCPISNQMSRCRIIEVGPRLKHPLSLRSLKPEAGDKAADGRCAHVGGQRENKAGDAADKTTLISQMRCALAGQPWQLGAPWLRRPSGQAESAPVLLMGQPWAGAGQKTCPSH